jgi:hypothetical protein
VAAAGPAITIIVVERLRGVGEKFSSRTEKCRGDGLRKRLRFEFDHLTTRVLLSAHVGVNFCVISGGGLRILGYFGGASSIKARV